MTQTCECIAVNKKVIMNSKIIDSASVDRRAARQNNRRHEMAETIIAEGSIHIEDLSNRFGISLMTAHRDVDDLAKRGLCRKTRGIVSVSPTSLIESSYIYRTIQQPIEKNAIAREAMKFIEPGQAIFLDDSTTAYQMAALLPHKVPLMLITNSLNLINELKDVNDLSLICLGGQYHHWCNAFIGHITVNEIQQLRADTVFLSLSAITDGQAFHQSPDIVETKRAMLTSSVRRIILADNTKFERRALHRVAPLKDFDAVIVDKNTPHDYVDKMRSEGINVIVAKDD